MTHPNLATMALYAGGDLGRLVRWRTERHLAGCGRCRAEVEALERTRAILPDLAEIPEVPWSRLAAEMKANIRVGLEAGQCVRAEGLRMRAAPFFKTARVAMTLASLAALLVTGMVLERPGPVTVPEEGLVVQAMANGIQVRQGGQTLRMMNPNKNERVTYSPDADGSMRARYVDPVTGYVTINKVYVQ